ncbi:hypothetical protein THAOC_27780, partial [Thalassiosira oceanica]
DGHATNGHAQRMDMQQGHATDGHATDGHAATVHAVLARAAASYVYELCAEFRRQIRRLSPPYDMVSPTSSWHPRDPPRSISCVVSRFAVPSMGSYCTTSLDYMSSGISPLGEPISAIFRRQGLDIREGATMGRSEQISLYSAGILRRSSGGSVHWSQRRSSLQSLHIIPKASANGLHR